MAAPKGNKNAIGNKGGVGGPEVYKPEFAAQAKKACEAGFTDRELADLFSVDERTIRLWKLEHIEFASSLKVGKAPADERVERSLFNRAVGYKHEAFKIFMPQGASEPVYAPYTEVIPPDTTAGIFWLKNRRPDQWRDKQDIEVTGKLDLASRIQKSLASARGRKED